MKKLKLYFKAILIGVRMLTVDIYKYERFQHLVLKELYPFTYKPSLFNRFIDWLKNLIENISFDLHKIRRNILIRCKLYDETKEIEKEMEDAEKFIEEIKKYYPRAGA